MKKACLAVLALVFSAGLFACKGHELCPAYGNAKNNPEQKAVQAENDHGLKQQNV